MPLTPDVIVDLSHESLMRCWTRLIAWAQEERASAAFYVRLSREATWWRRGRRRVCGAIRSSSSGCAGGATTGRRRPGRDATTRRSTAPWQFLDRSEQERDRVAGGEAVARADPTAADRVGPGRRPAGRAASSIGGWTASRAAKSRPRRRRTSALRRRRSTTTLVATDRDQNERRRRCAGDGRSSGGSCSSARSRSTTSSSPQQPGNEKFVTEMGFAHFRLGEISRMLDSPADAEKEYRASITLLEKLVRDHPQNADHRQALATAYNSLGELLRPSVSRRDEAEKAYASALALQNALTRESPTNPAYQQELARTHYNRGVLFGGIAEPNNDAFRAAEADFREAIRVLEPLVAEEGQPAGAAGSGARVQQPRGHAGAGSAGPGRASNREAVLRAGDSHARRPRRPAIRAIASSGSSWRSF